MTERAVAILPGDDLRVARAFYVEALGFSVLWEWTEDGREGLLGLERGGLRLTIDCPMSGHGRHACVGFEVEDADAYHAAWKGRVEQITDPKDEEWGARTFGVQDPFGNTLFVMGRG